MLVHNCYVEDGQGEKRMVIDERGCHVDLVLGDPTYVKGIFDSTLTQWLFIMI
jgi:hypothetical protein